MMTDRNSGITRVGYDANNQPDSVTFSTGESIRYYYDGMGNRLGTDEYTAFMPVYLQGATNTLTDDDDREVLRRRYCGNFVYEDGILQRVLVEGGFITFSNGAPQYHFYIKDHLGSNRVVTDADGNIEEYNHYYPYGALMNISSASTQPYKYNGKELNRLNRLLWYNQSARQYNPILGRFMSMDPLCEKYYSISPYAFCANNPVNAIDPDGRSTWVLWNNDGTYRVHGGDLNDNDLNIYEGTLKDGIFIRGKSIGKSALITSFYNSDANDGEGAWAKDAKIDPNDLSGRVFLEKDIKKENPSLLVYAVNARNGKYYDFKVTGGRERKKYDSSDGYYRGMPIGKNADGQYIYASARDIGNIGAGYVAAANGIPYSLARKAFDIYQGGKEGISTQNAEHYGWKLGQKETTTLTKITNFQKSFFLGIW